MKAEHRHELKTNELAQWLSNFPQWAKDNIRMIVYVCVVIVAVLVLYGWKYYKRNVIEQGQKLRFSHLIAELNRNKVNTINNIEKDGVDYSYTLIQTADKLGNFARTTKDDNMSALAYIKRAEGIRAELYYRSEPIQQQYLKDQIAKAKKSYENAIKKAVNVPYLLAMAHYGLGLCEEELGNFDKAKEIYQKIIDDEKFAGTATVASIRHRLNVMDDYKTKVTFQKVITSPPIEPESFLNMTPGSGELKLDDITSTPPAEIKTPEKPEIPNITE